MKTPELGFGGSNSVYNLEKGPRVRVQPLGTRGPLRCATPELLAAICHRRSSTQGSPRFQKLARDREEGQPTWPHPRGEGTPLSGHTAGPVVRRLPAWSSAQQPRGRSPLYPESALCAEVPGFFIGFSAATTRSSLASPAPAAGGHQGTAGMEHWAAAPAPCTHLLPFSPERSEFLAESRHRCGEVGEA